MPKLITAGVGVIALAVLTTTAVTVLGYVEQRSPGAMPANYSCNATAAGLHCTFTNTGYSVGMAACTRGKLMPKGKDGPVVESMPLCSGRLAPRSSIVMTGGWVKGSPDDVCKSTVEIAGQRVERTDWDACEFDLAEM